MRILSVGRISRAPEDVQSEQNYHDKYVVAGFSLRWDALECNSLANSNAG